jgi:hypothetical protein
MRWGWSDEFKAWFRLGLRTRQEVVQLARAGQSHPDPQVSTVAFEHASRALREFTQHAVLQWLVALAFLIIGLVYLATGHGLTPYLALAVLPPLLLRQRRRLLLQIAEANGFRSE